jgi:hypothetical protein
VALLWEVHPSCNLTIRQAAVLQASSPPAHSQVLLALPRGTALELLMLVVVAVLAALPASRQHSTTMLQEAVLQVGTDAQQRLPCMMYCCVALHAVLAFQNCLTSSPAAAAHTSLEVVSAKVAVQDLCRVDQLPAAPLAWLAVRRPGKHVWWFQCCSQSVQLPVS